MARPDKVAAVEEVKRGLNDSAATLLTHYRGLSVTELQQLRRELRQTNASYRVIKNTLSKRAVDEAGFDGLEELLEGPTGMVFCEEDPVGPAKALKAFARDHPELVIRGGYLDGEVLDGEAAARLADLSSREELLGQLAGLMQGALSNTARLLNAGLEQQARLMQALADKRAEAGEDAGAPAPEAATTDADAPAATEPEAESEDAAAASGAEEDTGEASAAAEGGDEEPEPAAGEDEASSSS